MEADIKLINKVKKFRDEKSLKTMIEKHSGIYIDMVNKYIPDSINGVNKDDLIEEKDYHIYNALINYDVTKNTKFSTYLGNLTKWKCLNIYNKNTKFPQENIESAKVDKISCPSELKNVEDRESLEKIYKLVDKSSDPRVKKIFKMRYSGEKKLTPWKKIAKKLDLSIQGCINIHNNYLQEVKKYVQ
jgi:DNA-directed RNA polymerase specialized sigma subunit